MNLGFNLTVVNYMHFLDLNMLPNKDKDSLIQELFATWDDTDLEIFNDATAPFREIDDALWLCTEVNI